MWQQRFKLEDWNLSVVMIRRADMRPGTRGQIRWDKEKRSAVIWVLDAADYHLPFNEMLDDMEFTIVHELIHLELAAQKRSEAYRSTEERVANRLAETLLRLAGTK